jgi:DinB superfamily
MEHELNNTIAVLERTPGALDALLRDLPKMWTMQNEGEKTWSVLDVVGHLIHGERSDWIPRVKMILEFGESKTFVPFDREGHAQEIAGRPVEELLDEFARARGENLRTLGELKIRPEDLRKRGRHPGFGVVTLSQLLATWATHDLTHFHQISRILAHQYRELVGPWSVYLGVLQCEGHSAAPVESVGTPE